MKKFKPSSCSSSQASEHMISPTSLFEREMEQRKKEFLGTDNGREILLKHEEIQREHGLGVACLHIAKQQTSIPQAMKWLRVSAGEKCHDAIIIYAALLYALNPDLEYKGDEAALWLNRKLNGYFLKGVKFDRSGSRSVRGLTRILLSGSLSKNQDSVLYRSFFRSGLREVHLLPLISKYLKNERKEEGERSFKEVLSLSDIALLLINNTSRLTNLYICISEKEAKDTNLTLCLLPLLLSHLPPLSYFSVYSDSSLVTPEIDLSLLNQTDTSKLHTLFLDKLHIPSLSPLSLCDLSSLQDMQLGSEYAPIHNLRTLDGLTKENTVWLENLSFSCPDLVDISSLSRCDLSSLEMLSFEDCSSLSDLSPLRGVNLSSLKDLIIQRAPLVDFSPLCECMNLTLKRLCLVDCPIEDISPFSRLNLSRLVDHFDISGSKVSDLSPLESISLEGIKMRICDTPAAEEVHKRGLKSPLFIGKVQVWY